MPTEDRLQEICERLGRASLEPWVSADIKILLEEVGSLRRQRKTLACLLSDHAVKTCDVCTPTTGCSYISCGYYDAKTEEDFIKVAENCAELLKNFPRGDNVMTVRGCLTALALFAFIGLNIAVCQMFTGTF
jgi:uncharacterized protein (UPF0264 family)